jgi:hypothetical protein
MGVHPDLTAHRAVDACGGTYSAEEREERWAEGHKAALDAACEAVKAPDALTAQLLAALQEGRRAVGDHWAPNDCYATGPLTGDGFRDLVECPACSFIAMYDAAIAKAEGHS